MRKLSEAKNKSCCCILYTLQFSTGDALLSIKIKVLLFTVFLCFFFESFRRGLNEAKAVYIAEYYLVCRFCNYDAPIMSQVSINVVNYC